MWIVLFLVMKPMHGDFCLGLPALWRDESETDDALEKVLLEITDARGSAGV